MSEYWLEHAEIAMNEAGLTATDEQLDTIAGVIESAHEFYGQSMGHDVASANLSAHRDRELSNAKKALEAERAKITCRNCRGTGREIVDLGFRSSDSECWKCKGQGRI